MFRSAFLFVCHGFLWLFIFALPISQSQSIYDMAYKYVVDTRPVYWIVYKFKRLIKEPVPNRNAEETPSIFTPLEDRLSKADLSAENF